MTRKSAIILLISALAIPLEAQAASDQHTISAAAVIKKLKQNRNILLVDVRPKTEFEKFKIPGSINIPIPR